MRTEEDREIREKESAAVRRTPRRCANGDVAGFRGPTRFDLAGSRRAEHTPTLEDGLLHCGATALSFCAAFCLRQGYGGQKTRDSKRGMARREPRPATARVSVGRKYLAQLFNAISLVKVKGMNDVETSIISRRALPAGADRPFMRRVFTSGQGLRAGWSLAIFLAIDAALTLAAQYSFATMPVLRDWSARQPQGVIAPLENIAFTGLELLILLVAVAVTARIEHRSFGCYGLRARGRGPALYVQGMAFGFWMASALIGLIALFGGFSVNRLAIAGLTVLSNAFLYGIGFMLVGFFEEFAFRGYMQATLGRGIGKWGAGVILSLAFGAMHLPNYGGAWVSALAAACFGMLAVYSLHRTGSLWFFIGAHSIFDWSITFLYSTPIAGLPAQVHLFDASLHGPAWLTGGHAGPAGSVMAFAVFALAGAAIRLLFPRVESAANAAN